MLKGTLILCKIINNENSHYIKWSGLVQKEFILIWTIAFHFDRLNHWHTEFLNFGNKQAETLQGLFSSFDSEQVYQSTFWQTKTSGFECIWLRFTWGDKVSALFFFLTKEKAAFNMGLIMLSIISLIATGFSNLCDSSSNFEILINVECQGILFH